jgi:hypothetical protein
MTAPRQVRTGVQIDVELIDQRGDAEPLSFVIVGEKAADFDQGFLAASAPLAKAILGKAVGSEIAYRRSDVVAVRILSVGAESAAVLEDAAAHRQETVKKALQEAERTTVHMFATSFSSKWGDYDPDVLATGDEDPTSDGETQA